MRIVTFIKATVLALLLISTVIGALAFAHAWAPDPVCFTSISKSQFPKWLGCAMATHEDLAGALIGAAGVLFAAWLAWAAVQAQRNDAEIQLASKRMGLMFLIRPGIHQLELILGEARSAPDVDARKVKIPAALNELISDLHILGRAGERLLLMIGSLRVRNDYIDEIATGGDPTTLAPAYKAQIHLSLQNALQTCRDVGSELWEKNFKADLEDAFSKIRKKKKDKSVSQPKAP